MALWIEYETELGTQCEPIEWHVGERLPFMLHENKVAALQADGDELLYIMLILGDKSYAGRRVCKWHNIAARLVYTFMWCEVFAVHKAALRQCAGTGLGYRR